MVSWPMLKNQSVLIRADLIFRCSHDLEQFGLLTRPTLAALDGHFPFESNVLYALIHEACYCQGYVFCGQASIRLKPAKRVLQGLHPTGRQIGP